MTLAVLAAAVTLSLTNASDYVSSIPASTSNMIRGVGMGSHGAYRTMRGEDADFLLTAWNERMMTAGLFPGIAFKFKETSLFPTDLRNYATFLWVDHDYLLTNAYPVTFDYAETGRFRADTGSRLRGFVPTNFTVWTGFYKCQTTNGWVRSGFDAGNDIRAVFDPSLSIGYPTNALPNRFDFQGIPSFQKITNSYNTIERGAFDAVLASPEIVYTNGWSSLTNAYSFSDTGFSITGEVRTTYTVDGKTYSYISSLLTSQKNGIFTGVLSEYKRIRARSERQLWYETHWSVERSSTNGLAGILHVQNPVLTADELNTFLPTNSAKLYATMPIYIGYDSSRTNWFANTNLEIRAYAVALWDCTSSRTLTGRYGANQYPAFQGSATNTSVHAITCMDLGTLDHPYPLTWVSQKAVDEIVTSAMNFAEAGGCFLGRYFSPPAVPSSVSILPGEYPPTVTNGWTVGSSPDGFGQTVNIYHNEIDCKKLYIVAVVKPTYHARVINDVPQ